MKTLYDIPNILDDIANNLDRIATVMENQEVEPHIPPEENLDPVPPSKKLKEMLKGLTDSGEISDPQQRADQARRAEDVLAMIRKRNEDK